MNFFLRSCLFSPSFPRVLCNSGRLPTVWFGGQPWIHDPSAFSSWVPGLHVGTIMPNLCRIEDWTQHLQHARLDFYHWATSQPQVFRRLVEIKTIWLLGYYIFSAEEWPCLFCLMCLWLFSKLAQCPKQCWFFDSFVDYLICLFAFVIFVNLEKCQDLITLILTIFEK